MVYDADLARRVRGILRGRGALSERSMFGGLAFLLNGNMFVGVIGATLMARVGPERHADALAKPHARAMDFTGRPMKGYVFVDPEGLRDERDLRDWVEGCAAFAATLPGKPAKREGARPARRR